MFIQRAMWTGSGAILLFFVVIGALASPLSALVALSIPGCLAGLVTHYVLRQRAAEGRTAPGLLAQPGASLIVSGMWLAAVLALIGASAVLGEALGFVILIAIIAGWAAVILRRRRDPAAGQVAVVADAGHHIADRDWADPSVMTMEQLCLVWRQSYAWLLKTPPGQGRERLVRMRSSVLDEMESRDADGFARWLQDGARAASDPSRYLTTGGQPG